MHQFSNLGHEKVAEFLTLNGANIDAKDKNGCTAVQIACSNGN